MVYQAVNPWASSVWAVRRLEEQGPRYYKADRRSSALQARIRTAFKHIRAGDYSRAIQEVEQARRGDPSNPLLDYVRAGLEHGRGDAKAAMAFVRSGNKLGPLRLYCSVDPAHDGWNWPEFAFVRRMAERLARETEDEDELEQLVLAGQKLIWASPPDPGRLMHGISVREVAAQKLGELAGKRGQAESQTYYNRLVRDGKELRWSARRQLGGRSPYDNATRAWIVGRALRENDADYRRASMLLFRENGAAWAQELRDTHVKDRELELP